jgi:hypothetical protein
VNDIGAALAEPQAHAREVLVAHDHPVLEELAALGIFGQIAAQADKSI